MLKATLFTLYYLHHKFLTDDPLSPMVFHQTFFYSVFQLLLNREISSKNRYFPKEGLVQAYQQYLQEFPTGGRPIASDASMEAKILSITAKSMAVTFANNLVENFESRYIEYLTLRFRELLPGLPKKQWSKLARHSYDSFAAETDVQCQRRAFLQSSIRE
ncbi:uncharacterized protein BYT42DRAFT_58275 [Radiomyces spectabilis]|uniref:uncharacterized protein n=1 Tax=Radiomyces spectabilis TaxID=64574 RepID=UPI00221EF564|nr:uncharacterized protein BYT42DRAFT_58275 [Radiomyces spectabilis]KAI8373099.1 hypothetical protein BYT42DRAFT_58275 [Radiomyces spectabilis]